MTGGTEVDTGELFTFARGMRTRGDAIGTASEKVGRIDYGPDAFGLFGAAINDDAQSAASRTTQGLMYLSQNVGIDATAVSDAATEYDLNEQAQTQQYRGAEHD